MGRLDVARWMVLMACRKACYSQKCIKSLSKYLISTHKPG
jgi:hypothetical protein